MLRLNTLLFCSMACALPTELSRRGETISKSIGTIGPGTYSLIFKVHEGVLRDMTVADSTGAVYADTAPGWGWGPSEVPNEMAFKVLQAQRRIVFSAVEESGGSAQVQYELKRTDAPVVQVLQSGQIS